MTKNFLKRNEKHRAVAPIIATLIMVAIAVVGGVMVYVFTQGFFTGTQTQAPTTDAIQMTGYDAREDAAAAATDLGITGHNGAPMVGIGDETTGDGKLVGEDIAINIKNLGTSDVTINKLEVNFVTYTAGTITAGDVVPVNTYTIISSIDTTTGAITAISNLPANTEVTIALSLGTAVPAGSSVPIEITTGSGSTFTFHATVGQRE